MGHTPSVSVVMPVRNGVPTLEAAARSILSGGLRDLELICVDDGSQDETPAILARLAAGDPRVRTVRQPPLGIVAALERGRAEASAPLVARMDADDLAHPDRLQAQLALLRARPDLGLVGCQVSIFGSAAGPGMARYERWVNGLCEPEEIHRERFVESPLVHPTWMLRRSLLAVHGGYRSGFEGPEDYDLLLRLLGAGVRAAKVPRVLLRWRDEHQRLTRTDPRCSAAAFLDLKVTHLLSGPLSDGRPYLLQGAGTTGKRACRALQRAGRGPEAFVDISPRRVGRTIHGVPVLPLEDLGRSDLQKHLVLIAVASPGSKSVIRSQLAALGRREPDQALFIA